jgi:hypothetical protein
MNLQEAALKRGTADSQPLHKVITVNGSSGLLSINCLSGVVLQQCMRANPLRQTPETRIF